MKKSIKTSEVKSREELAAALLADGAVFDADSYEVCRTIAEKSHVQIAAEIGVKAKTIYEWRSGRHQPVAKNVAALAELFGVDVNMLLVYPGQESEDECGKL